MDTVVQSIDAHVATVSLLLIPDVLDYDGDTYSHYIQSPVLMKTRLDAIRSDVTVLQGQAERLPLSPRVAELRKQIEWVLCELLDQKSYVVDRMIRDQQRHQQAMLAATQGDSHDDKPRGSVSSMAVATDEDLLLLRKRLLVGGESTKLDDNELNDYHDNVQHDLINELSDLTLTLRLGAVALSQKILGDDLTILNETNENLLKNLSTLRRIDNNLNKYLESKTGGKVGWIYMIKIAIIVAVVLVAALLMIALVPRF